MNLFKYENEVISRQYFIKSLKPYIKKGDILYAEIDVMRFGSLYSSDIKKKDLLEEIFNIFYELVGDDGHIIIPSFSYSWGSSNPKKVFDVLNTNGKVGIFPEYFRKRGDVVRTKDPMFSFLIWGKRREEFVAIGNSSFGINSVFEKVHKENAKLMSFGLTGYDPTFVHYVEESFDKKVKKIGYRQETKFLGTFVEEEKEVLGQHYCMMRPIDSKLVFSDENLTKKLVEKSLLVEIRVGASKISISDCCSVFDTIFEGMSENLYFLVKEV